MTAARKRTSGPVKRKDGRYTFRYLENGTKKGRRMQVTLPLGASFDEAKRVHRLKLDQAARRKGRAEFARLTFADLAADYLERHGPKMAVASLERARALLESRFLPLFKDRRLTL